MSYPRTIQCLFIEDELGVKDTYDTLLEDLRKDYEIAPACYAFSYEEALVELKTPKLFHLVVLDLLLPERRGTPAPENTGFGLELLSRFADREHAPVPVLLVVSGNVRITDQSLLQSSRAKFYKGEVYTKPSDLSELAKWLRQAIDAALDHQGIGIHLRDAKAGRFPTLSPREEDLLRRCALGKNAIGLDLEWYSAEYIHTTDRSGFIVGWTKTLFGYFLFPGDRSRPHFFKFMPQAEADYVFAAADRMASKLSQFKSVTHDKAGGGALLITEKAGSLGTRPKPLQHYLHPGAENIADKMPRIAEDVSRQLSEIGQTTQQSAALSKLLWKHHEASRIANAWEKFGTGLPPEEDPSRLFESIRKSTQPIQYTQQAFVHGDLNASNIALDFHPDHVEAFIIDPAGFGPEPNIKDLAALEVSALLHQPQTQNGDNLVAACSFLYAQEFAPDDPNDGAASYFANVRALIRAIRKLQAVNSERGLYSLLVFDSVLTQLGGLEITLSGNKIGNPTSAALLTTIVGKWCRTQMAASGFTLD
jgi:CheY-like chemotaxis protein